MDTTKESGLREEVGAARCTCPDTARLLTAYLAGRKPSCDLHRPDNTPASNPVPLNSKDNPVPLNSKELETQLLAALTNH